MNATSAMTVATEVQAGHASIARYDTVRARSLALAAPLSAEDACVQSMPDCSPAKWHLAHVTWFFETFILERHEPHFAPHHAAFRELFNSYYNGVGPQHPRAARGLLTRPSLDEVIAYRAAVDARMREVLLRDATAVAPLLALGLHHEQQHQELLLMDIKHLLSMNPLCPAYRAEPRPASHAVAPLAWHGHAGGVVEVGHASDDFCFDNETPRHRALVESFELASRPVTNGEYLAFIEDGGYRAPALWLADGWATVNREQWHAPLYWRKVEGLWHEFTLRGLEPLDPALPVCHVSHYEADAYAAWADARLPGESEWEALCADVPVTAARNEAEHLHPRPADDGTGLRQCYDAVWQWTRSAYLPYPGFRAAPGAVGEYNGKFMSNQMVLKGGCCATPAGHARASYRNFFYPQQRWPFAGIRLARDA